jgi:excinuclease ABC subunit C
MDRIYLPGKRMPVYLEPALATTHMLQKIRDEAHRFAITYHRKLRTKKALTSPLENVPGIGKTRRLILLKHFGSLDAIRRASIDDIASVKGMNRKVAEDLKKNLMETLRHKEAKAQRND